MDKIKIQIALLIFWWIGLITYVAVPRVTEQLNALTPLVFWLLFFTKVISPLLDKINVHYKMVKS